MHDAGQIERSVDTFARSPNGGLIALARRWGRQSLTI
jgi:hypothetical protein